MLLEKRHAGWCANQCPFRLTASEQLPLATGQTSNGSLRAGAECLSDRPVYRLPTEWQRPAGTAESRPTSPRRGRSRGHRFERRPGFSACTGDTWESRKFWAWLRAFGSTVVPVLPFLDFKAALPEMGGYVNYRVRQDLRPVHPTGLE